MGMLRTTAVHTTPTLLGSYAQHEPRTLAPKHLIRGDALGAHAVVQVLGLDEDVGIQQIAHAATPRLRPSSLKVSSLENPRRRNASLWSVCPSSVLMTSARAKRLLTRAACVK